MLEYWSTGVMVASWIFFLQHSNTPSLQYSAIARLKDFKQLRIYLFIDSLSTMRIQSGVIVCQHILFISMNVGMVNSISAGLMRCGLLSVIDTQVAKYRAKKCGEKAYFRLIKKQRCGIKFCKINCSQ